MKKKIQIVCDGFGFSMRLGGCIGVAMLASSVGAQIAWVGDTAVNDAWEQGSNWSSSLVPTNTDDVVINAGSSVLNPVAISVSGQGAKSVKLGAAVGDFGALLMTGGDFYTPGELRIGDAGEGHLRMANGLFATKGAIALGRSSSGIGALFLEGGVLGCTNDVFVGYSGTGTVVIAGGTLYTSGNNFEPTLGYLAGSLGTLIISNGTLRSGYAMFVGVSGQGQLVQAGGDITMSRQLYIGSESSGSGKVDLTGGTFKVSYDCYVGDTGFGELNVSEGAGVTLSRCMKAGVDVGAEGVVRTEAVTILTGTDHYPYIVGEAGHGEMHPKGTTFKTNRNGLKVRLAASAYGLVNGWGTWTSTVTANYKVGVNVNNGLVIANGFGVDRDLDFSAYVASVNTSSTTNSIENISTNGWYAVNRGRLVLGGIDLGVGSGAGVGWGEAIGDTEIDLVNSARFEFSNVTTAGRLIGKLLASDRTDVPALPAGLACIGVWNFSFTGSFSEVDLQIRYDAVAAAEKVICLKRWNAGSSAWETVPTTEMSNARIEAAQLTELGLFAVFASEHPTLIVVK